MIRQGILGWVAQQLDRRLPSWARQAVSDLDLPVSVKDAGYPVRVAAVEDHQGQAVTLYLELLDGYRLHVRAGQFVCVTVQIGQSLYRRCYSLCGGSEDKYLAITVKRVFQGRVSNYLNDHIRVGDQLVIDDPAGEFVLPESIPPESQFVFVAAGSGIAPVYGLIRELLDKAQHADVQLVYTNRSKEQTLFRKSLAQLEAQYPGFRVTFHFTRRSDGGVDPTRRLTGKQLLGMISNAPDAHYYLCGPVGLTRELLDTLHHYGIPETRIKMELFTTHPNARDNAHLRSRAIVFRRKGLWRSRRLVRQRRVETVLETAHKAHIKIPSNCQTGTCKTCRVKLLKGHVVMDEPNSLTTDEAAQGYILACVAYPCETLDVQVSPRG